MHPFQHILVPTDFEEPAERAIHLATTLAGVVNARLTILHVFTTHEIEISATSLLPLEAMVAEAQWLLRDHVEEVEERGIVAEGLLVFGDPTTEILAAIDAQQADMVVMGTHGRRGGARLLLGSVAEEVVRRAKVPALTTSTRVRQHDTLRRSARVPRLDGWSRVPGNFPRSEPPLSRFIPAND